MYSARPHCTLRRSQPFGREDRAAFSGVLPVSTVPRGLPPCEHITWSTSPGAPTLCVSQVPTVGTAQVLTLTTRYLAVSSHRLTPESAPGAVILPFHNNHLQRITLTTRRGWQARACLVCSFFICLFEIGSLRSSGWPKISWVA